MAKLSLSIAKYDVAFEKFYDQIYESLHLQDEILRYFPIRRMVHAGSTRWLTEPDILEEPFQQHKNSTSGEIEIVTKTDVLKFKEFLLDLIIPLLDKAREQTIKIINLTCDTTGNKTDAANQNIWDAYIEAIEKIKMVFDNDGKPHFLLYPLDFYKKLAEHEPTLEQLDKVGKIFRRKKEEYDLKKGSRRLSKLPQKIKTYLLNEEIDGETLKSNLSLPKYNLAIVQLVRDVKNGFEDLDHILGKISRVPVSHGGITRQVSEPQILETPMQEYSGILTVKLDYFRNTDTEEFRDVLWKFSEEAIGQMKKYFFEVFPQICDATGNSFSAQGKNIWDAYLEMFEATQMHFDENGNHNYEFLVHPDTAKKMQACPPTPEQLAKGEEILERKKKEYYAQKRTRRLS